LGYTLSEPGDSIRETQADTFYEHGARAQIKASKMASVVWKPGLKPKHVYETGFKYQFARTDPHFGLAYYEHSKQPTPFDKI